MKRQVFFSFHYEADAWRAAQVRNMGVVEGDSPYSDNGWERARKYTDDGIKGWIEQQMRMRSCVVVLVGAQTASRKWVRYVIEEGWRKSKGVLAIDVHNLKDHNGERAMQGRDPMSLFYADKTFNWIRCGDAPLDTNEVLLSSIIPMKDPECFTSTYVYDEIKRHIEDWIEEAIEIRHRYPMP